MTTTKESIEQTAAELGLTMQAQFVPWSQSRNADKKDPQSRYPGRVDPSLNWKVTLLKDGKPLLTTDYMAGRAHCPSYKQGDYSVSRHDAIKLECERGCQSIITAGGAAQTLRGLPIQPNFADVLHSLATDADVIDYACFEEWAPEFGYDADSRKAESVYRACLEFALKLRYALGEDGLKKLREAVRDY